MTINSWNEWPEGSYVEPDKKHGTAYLDQIRRVFGKSSLGVSPARATTTYYVSQSSGSDNGDGQSPATAWKTLARASAAEYAPGDSILLKCGDAWNEELRPQGEGTAANPITISSYGDGPRPAIDRQDATGNNIDRVCIRLKNIAGYKVKGIEFARFGRGVFVDFDKGVHGKDYVDHSQDQAVCSPHGLRQPRHQ